MVSRILKRAAESVEKRADDNEATIKNRIETFIKNTDEILSQYPIKTKKVRCIHSSTFFHNFVSNFFYLYFSHCRLMVNATLMTFFQKFHKLSLTPLPENREYHDTTNKIRQYYVSAISVISLTPFSLWNFSKKKRFFFIILSSSQLI